jgi:tetratricopeptide (TPR) repeat protein
MERGVEASPMDPNMFCELGILYGAKGELQRAISMLKKSLQLDPGQGEAYFYLGLFLTRQGKTNLAWQAARIGEKLHYNQDILLEKLLLIGAPEPKHYPFQDPSSIFSLRQIILSSFEQGENLVARWNRGDSLEEFFWGRSEDNGHSFGGYIGDFTDADLKPEIFTAIDGNTVFDQPVIVETDGKYFLLQRILPFDHIYWTEPEEKKTVSEPEKNLATAAVTVPSENLPEKDKIKPDLGDEDPFKLEEADPQKIRLYSGAFNQKEIAIEQVVNLRDHGFPAYYLINMRSEGKTLFNVIAGEYSSREEALKAKEKLLEKGFESFLSSR